MEANTVMLKSFFDQKYFELESYDYGKSDAQLKRYIGRFKGVYFYEDNDGEHEGIFAKDFSEHDLDKLLSRLAKQCKNLIKDRNVMVRNYSIHIVDIQSDKEWSWGEDVKI